MPEFLELLPPSEALEKLLRLVPAREIPPEDIEEVPTPDAVGRVSASPVYATTPLPSFRRSTMDGYAVRAADTYGASEAMPVYLNILGEAPMGDAPAFTIGPAQCVLIHTGGMLPVGANAVVMIENSQKTQLDEVEINRAVAVGENLIDIGEDVAEGELVIPAGSKLGPAEIGGLMAFGFTTVKVVKPTRVAIISSGDEVIAPEKAIHPGQVRDINSYTLSALVEQAGGQPVRYGIVADRFEDLYAAANKALQECDMLVITAGSSASVRDLTAQVVSSLGAPGVLAHGVNIRPGKPTILAVCDGKPVIGLPGNPVSALVVARLMVLPVIRRLLGKAGEPIAATVKARLTINISSQAGREDWIPVKLSPSQDGFSAEPVFGKSNLIFTLVRADGLVMAPPDANGLSAGAEVDVHLL